MHNNVIAKQAFRKDKNIYFERNIHSNIGMRSRRSISFVPSVQVFFGLIRIFRFRGFNEQMVGSVETLDLYISDDSLSKDVPNQTFSGNEFYFSAIDVFNRLKSVQKLKFQYQRCRERDQVQRFECDSSI